MDASGWPETQEISKGKKKRFYDEDPTVSKAVDSLLLFPDEIQRIIAKGFSIIAERDCNAEELLKEFRTLGSERVLALYKSKKKQRSYDQNPTVHNAMNYLLVMDEKSRVFLASKVIELVGFMQEYLKVCRNHSINPEIKTVEDISNVYVERGPAEARAFIAKLDEEFKKRLLGGAPEPESVDKKPRVKNLIEGIEAQNTGMRVKGDTL